MKIYQSVLSAYRQGFERRDLKIRGRIFTALVKFLGVRFNKEAHIIWAYGLLLQKAKINTRMGMTLLHTTSVIK